MTTDGEVDIETLEHSVDELHSKIRDMNQHIEVILKERRDASPTDTLRAKLRSCISQITMLLLEISEGTKEDKLEVNWDEARKTLADKRLELEKRLYMQDPQAKTKKLTRRQEVRKQSVQAVRNEELNKSLKTKYQNDSQRRTNKVLEDALQDEDWRLRRPSDTDMRRALKRSAMSASAGVQKRKLKSQHAISPEVGRHSGRKRPQREIAGIASVFDGVINDDWDSAHQRKNPRSISKKDKKLEFTDTSDESDLQYSSNSLNFKEMFDVNDGQTDLLAKLRSISGDEEYPQHEGESAEEEEEGDHKRKADNSNTENLSDAEDNDASDVNGNSNAVAEEDLRAEFSSQIDDGLLARLNELSSFEQSSQQQTSTTEAKKKHRLSGQSENDAQSSDEMSSGKVARKKQPTSKAKMQKIDSEGNHDGSGSEKPTKRSVRNLKSSASLEEDNDSSNGIRKSNKAEEDEGKNNAKSYGESEQSRGKKKPSGNIKVNLEGFSFNKDEVLATLNALSSLSDDKEMVASPKTPSTPKTPKSQRSKREELESSSENAATTKKSSLSKSDFQVKISASKRSGGPSDSPSSSQSSRRSADKTLDTTTDTTTNTVPATSTSVDKNSEIAPGSFTPSRTRDLLAKLNSFKKDPFLIKKKEEKKPKEEVPTREKETKEIFDLKDARAKLIQGFNYAGNRITDAGNRISVKVTKNILGMMSSSEKKAEGDLKAQLDNDEDQYDGDQYDERDFDMERNNSSEKNNNNSSSENKKDLTNKPELNFIRTNSKQDVPNSARKKKKRDREKTADDSEGKETKEEKDSEKEKEKEKEIKPEELEVRKPDRPVTKRLQPRKGVTEVRRGSWDGNRKKGEKPKRSRTKAKPPNIKVTKTKKTIEKQKEDGEQETKEKTQQQKEEKIKQDSEDNTKEKKQEGEKLAITIDAVVEKSDSWESQSEEAQDDDDEDDKKELITSFGVTEEMNKPGLIRGKKFNITATGKANRYQMEDTSYCCYPLNDSPNLGLFCVFDGHAGSNCAQKLTKLFPRIFTKHWLRHEVDQLDLSSFWNTVYEEVDDGLKEFEYEGATATTLFIWRAPDGRRYLQCANVGDSTCFICRDGAALMLSEDHKATSPNERKRIEEMGIKLEDCQTRVGGLGVTRAFGDHFPKSENIGTVSKPFISQSIKLTSTDSWAIVASDGLWDILSGQKAFDLIKTLEDPEEASAKLVRTALQSPKCTDNITVIVVKL